MSLGREAIMAALSEVQEPDLKQDLISLNMIRDLSIEGTTVSLRVVLSSPLSPVQGPIQNAVETALKALGAEPEVTMDFEVQRATPQKTGPSQRLPGVKSIVAIASGKGGVGKSTVAANVAVTLAKAGARVGLLDADIYGPSMPVMLGLQGARPQLNERQKIEAMARYGLKVMSMGFMLEDDDAVVWRGPMLGKALQQFIDDVDWGELDYLILDLPPGTGDVQLSLAQLLPVTGAAVVTTPQDVAFADVRRAIKMCATTRIHVLGLVENMSVFHCTECNAAHHLFGESRINEHAERHELKVLAQIPLDTVTAIAADKGQPISSASPHSPAAESYRQLAGRIAREVAMIAHQNAPSQDKHASFFKMAPPAS